MIRRLLAHRRYMREQHWTHAHLSEYLDDELSAEERERIEDHVSMCPHCRRVLRTQKRTQQGLKDLAADPRPDVADGVIDRLRGEF